MLIESWLSFWLLMVPLVGVFFLLFLSPQWSRVIALVTSLLGVALGGIAFYKFDAISSMPFHWVTRISWIARFGIEFGIGVDGLSLPLIALTKFIMPTVILSGWGEKVRTKAFMACYLFLDFAMTGTFLATDIFLFYVFWELMLLPMILLIGIWGQEQRIYAAVKFFLFTLGGSLLMLASIFVVFITFWNQQGMYSGEIRSFYGLNFASTPVIWNLGVQDLVFFGFLLAFAVKIPLFPLHTWLPDAHVQAPTGGSILLAAILLKMGVYGMLRFLIPICPQSFERFVPELMGISLISILYGAWVAYQQRDMKKLIAYSSVSHLGLVVLGVTAMNNIGLYGAILQMVNHGLSTGALFLLVGILYERRHSRLFSDLGGLAPIVPWYAFFLGLVTFSSMAVPGLNGFVGEFLILLGSFRNHPVLTSLATLGIIFGSIYCLVMLREVLFGTARTAENHSLKDLGFRDACALVPLVILIILLGIVPQVFLQKLEPTVERYWSSVYRSHAVAERKGAR